MTTTTQKLPRGFSVKPLHIAGVAIILVAVVFGAFGIQDGFRSYTTSISEAKQSGSSLQLAGFLGSMGEYDAQGRWTFLLEDEAGDQVKVIYDQPRPSNFEQAVSIVAIGHYDTAQGVFIAEDLLVKCPSKYQEELQV